LRKSYTYYGSKESGDSKESFGDSHILSSIVVDWVKRDLQRQWDDFRVRICSVALLDFRFLGLRGCAGSVWPVGIGQRFGGHLLDLSDGLCWQGGRHVAQIGLWVETASAARPNEGEEDGAASLSPKSRLNLHMQKPILRFVPSLSPECSVFAFFTFAISRSIIACVTIHFAESESTLPHKSHSRKHSRCPRH
jgi:hypothetical protein